MDLELKGDEIVAINVGDLRIELQQIRIVFDGPPAADPSHYVTVEDEQGKFINFGAWHSRPDGLWELRFTAATAATPIQ